MDVCSSADFFTLTAWLSKIYALSVVSYFSEKMLVDIRLIGAEDEERKS